MKNRKREIRKKSKKKRKASSPNNNNNIPLLSGQVSSFERTKPRTKKCKPDGDKVNKSSTLSSCGYSFDSSFPINMSFQPQSGSFNMTQSQPQAQAQYMQSPPPGPTPFGNPGFTYQTAPQTVPPPPPWAMKLLEDMELVKQKISSIDKIEKTVNLISTKMSDLEIKMQGLDMRVTETETSCSFVSNMSETNKKELKTTKVLLSQLQKSCKDLEKESSDLKKKNATLDAKIIDLESRSMRENLMFYGIKEGGDSENCEELVKNVCIDNLEMHETFTRNMIFDRAHRVGPKKQENIRPIVVKFHYFSERELVRAKSFEHAETLKNEQLGIGVQLPKDVRDARKPLYPEMKKAKDEGKSVKFRGKKLYINGAEYVPPRETGAGEPTGNEAMQH